MKLRSSDWWDIVICAGIVAVVLSLATVCDAAPVCHVQKVVAPNYVATLAVAPVYYQVGQSLQREAADTLQFRHSEEYIELQQLRGFKAGVDAVTASGDRPSSPVGLATKGSDNPAGAEQPPAPPADTFAGRYPTLAAKCSKCHGGDTPKGDVFIDGSVPLDGPDAAGKRDAIARAIINEHMPPSGPLEAQEQFNALTELFTEPATGEEK
jgi:hypothetical protein